MHIERVFELGAKRAVLHQRATFFNKDAGGMFIEFTHKGKIGSIRIFNRTTIDTITTKKGIEHAVSTLNLTPRDVKGKSYVVSASNPKANVVGLSFTVVLPPEGWASDAGIKKGK